MHARIQMLVRYPVILAERTPLTPSSCATMLHIDACARPRSLRIFNSRSSCTRASASVATPSSRFIAPPGAAKIPSLHGSNPLHALWRYHAQLSQINAVESSRGSGRPPVLSAYDIICIERDARALSLLGTGQLTPICERCQADVPRKSFQGSSIVPRIHFRILVCQSDAYNRILALHPPGHRVRPVDVSIPCGPL